MPRGPSGADTAGGAPRATVPPSRAYRPDNALRWPVATPAGTRYLSSGQRATLTLVRLRLRRGPATLDELARLTGTGSRGRLWQRLDRLRSLGLIGFRAASPGRIRATPCERHGATPDRCRHSPGRGHGRLLVWIPRAARRLGPRPRWRNDSVSTPFGGFLTREGLAAATTRGGGPPGSGGRGALAGPRRGPPRVLYGRCPAGHRCRLGRRSLTGSELALVAAFRGSCRRCGRRVAELVTIRWQPPAARPLSPAELEDPAVLEDRRRRAAELVADPATPWRLRVQLTRDYLEPR